MSREAKWRDRLNVLRRIAGYASYRVYHTNEETAKSELASLKWALAILEETRDTLGPDGWAALLIRAEGRDPAIELPVPRARAQARR